MKARERWRPTKFVLEDGHLAPSRDPRALFPGSRLAASVLAPAYERMIREHATGALVDLGCGEVPLYAVYRDLVTEVVCVDRPGAAVRGAHVDVEADLEEDLPFPAAAFDTVVLTDVLEHVARPEHLVREIARILRPGGKLLCAVPFLYWLHEEPHDYFRYTEHALRRLCARAGLDVVELTPTGGAPEVLLDILGKHAAVAAPLQRVHQLVGTALLRSALGRRWSRRTERRFPFGYCLVARRPATVP